MAWQMIKLGPQIASKKQHLSGASDTFCKHAHLNLVHVSSCTASTTQAASTQRLASVARDHSFNHVRARAPSGPGSWVTGSPLLKEVSS